MIQRIIDWCNGYTLEDKLELELLHQYVIFQHMKEAATELNEMIVCYPMSDIRGLIREEKTWKPSDFNYTPVFNEYEYGVTNYNIDKVSIQQLWEGFGENGDSLSLLQKIKLLNEPGSIFRVRMNIKSYNDDKKFQFSKEYCIKDLIQQMKLELLNE
jgi:hypothetical protein